MSPEEASLVDEGMTVLSQGVEMIHFDVSASDTQRRKVVWVDAKIHRICVYYNKPEETDVAHGKGKVSPGIYLRDLSEVRRGFGAFDFMENEVPPETEGCCLALIGSERSICLQLPSKVISRSLFVVQCN
jgi:hypothetical protein